MHLTLVLVVPEVALSYYKNDFSLMMLPDVLLAGDEK